ncbi:hypothetical protein UY3_16778 [Chelonia mydas]|uniref:Uncharacterized protein n=1 Tax=Chelonia mydas TaxID=8469 RepID=M7ANL3_CHEMY|nr:hypothetical protein UY3_16778 [Chelonia mydas]
MGAAGAVPVGSGTRRPPGSPAYEPLPEGHFRELPEELLLEWCCYAQLSSETCDFSVQHQYHIVPVPIELLHSPMFQKHYAGGMLCSSR